MIIACCLGGIGTLNAKWCKDFAMDWLKELASDDFGKAVLTVSGTLLITAFGAFIGGAKDIAVDWWKRRRLVKY